jgi:prepilin-type N-terminal cleavage/methylation domain-containing protein
MKKSTDAGGFTLLEVLAAVAILGMWFAVLAGVAIQGLRAEGENERRIRASLIADRVLADIELNLNANQLPEETDTETEEDEFTIVVSLIPLPELEFAELDPQLLLLLEQELATLAADLYAIHVHVGWIEGVQEEEVTRLIYTWDSAPLFEQLNAAQGTSQDEEGRQPTAEDIQGALDGVRDDL